MPSSARGSIPQPSLSFDAAGGLRSPVCSCPRIGGSSSFLPFPLPLAEIDRLVWLLFWFPFALALLQLAFGALTSRCRFPPVWFTALLILLRFAPRHLPLPFRVLQACLRASFPCRGWLPCCSLGSSSSARHPCLDWWALPPLRPLPCVFPRYQHVAFAAACLNLAPGLSFLRFYVRIVAYRLRGGPQAMQAHVSVRCFLPPCLYCVRSAASQSFGRFSGVVLPQVALLSFWFARALVVLPSAFSLPFSSLHASFRTVSFRPRLAASCVYLLRLLLVGGINAGHRVLFFPMRSLLCVTYPLRATGRSPWCLVCACRSVLIIFSRFPSLVCFNRTDWLRPVLCVASLVWAWSPGLIVLGGPGPCCAVRSVDDRAYSSYAGHCCFASVCAFGFR